MGSLGRRLAGKQINVAEKTPGRLVIKLFAKINGKSGREAAVLGRARGPGPVWFVLEL